MLNKLLEQQLLIHSSQNSTNLANDTKKTKRAPDGENHRTNKKHEKDIGQAGHLQT